MKSYVVKQLFKARCLAAIFAVALASPAMSQSSYCSDGSASCPEQPSSNNGNSAPSNNGAAPNPSGAYCPDGSASCPSRSGNNGTAGNASVNCNSGNTYRSDGSAGNANGSGNNGRAPSNNGGAWVNPTNAATYNPDGSAGNANGRSNCGNNGCGFAGDAQRQSQANELPAPQPSNNGTSPNLPSPVQGGGGGDTLLTGPVPSNPVPQNPVPATTELTYEQVMTPEELALSNRLPYAERATTLYSPSQIKQIKSDGRWENWLADARRFTAPIAPSQPTVTPVSPSSSAASLAAPMRIAPTNSGELAPTIPIQWSPVAGATHYELAVRDLTTNAFVVDQNVYGTIFERSPYPSGRTFRWTVRACNQSGCGGWSTPWQFRTVAETMSDTCRIEVRFKPVAAQISNHAFIVTSDSNSITYFRGGPESNEAAVTNRRSLDISNLFFGQIVTETGSYTPGTADWIVSPSGQHNVAVLRSNCDEVDRKFGTYISDIEQASINYNLLYRNSNSVVREILERSGYTYFAPPVRATAWDAQIP